MKYKELKKTKNGIVIGGYYYNDRKKIAIKGNRNPFGYNVLAYNAIEADKRFEKLKQNRPKNWRNGHYSFSNAQCESLGYKLIINRKFDK